MSGLRPPLVISDREVNVLKVLKWAGFLGLAVVAGLALVGALSNRAATDADPVRSAE